MPLDTFREQAFAAALPPACEYRATAFGPHPDTKAVLTLACSFGWLVGPLHKTGK
jgi:hypothetical protein